MSANDVDYASLLQANLARVFGESDPARRRAAIAEIYAADAILYEPYAIATGHAEITAAVDAVLDSLPPGFVFAANGPGVGHHGLGRLKWQAGPPGGPVAVTGTDVVRFEAGRIQTLHVFLDPLTT